MVSITTGLGAVTGIGYKPLTDKSVYTKDSGGSACGTPYTCYDIQDATYVVSQFTQSNGVGGTNTTTYQYGTWALPGMKKIGKYLK